MLKIITTLTVFLIGMLAKGQVVENRNVSEFSKVKVANGINMNAYEKSVAKIKSNNYIALNVNDEAKFPKRIDMDEEMQAFKESKNCRLVSFNDIRN